MASDLSALLAASKNLTSHLSRPDLPSVQLSLDQIEAQSRRLVQRQHNTAADADRANYLLAQAHVDASALANTISHLNTATTFSPLQQLQDTDVAGYLRHAHEQTLITTIEEGRAETQDEFYRLLEERGQRDWEARKRRLFEELGGRLGVENRAVAEMKMSSYGRGGLGASTSAPAAPSREQTQKQLIYGQQIVELNKARLRGEAFAIIHALRQAAATIAGSGTSHQIIHLYDVLAKITAEPSYAVPVEHAGAHILNTAPQERRLARLHLRPDSREAADLRKQIARGAREALEEQYWDVLERTLRARRVPIGGDPSDAHHVAEFVAARYYVNGEWTGGVELFQKPRPAPLWAILFTLVRTGRTEAALEVAVEAERAIEAREAGFVARFKAWLQAPDRQLSRMEREELQNVYNAHMLHAKSTDPFKLALYKLMGKLEPTRRSVPVVTSTAEDWLWFQLAMVDEDTEGGLRGLAETLLGYGARHFEGPNGRPELWAQVLLVCGQFERAVAALLGHPDTEVDGVHIAIALAYHGLLRVPSRAEASDIAPLTIVPNSPPALNLPTVLWRYVRPFVKHGAEDALQYVYFVCLSADQGGEVGREQVEIAWELVRRIIVLSNGGPTWERLVGGFRADGTRTPGTIEQHMSLLKLRSKQQYNEQILMRAAKESEDNDRTAEAIKLYNLAEDYATVVSCLARALGNTIAQTAPDAKCRALERTAEQILDHYARTNRAAGKDKDAVAKLLKIRRAMNLRNAGELQRAMDVLDSTDLLVVDNDLVKISKRAEEFKDLHEALQRNFPLYTRLYMDILHQIKQSETRTVSSTVYLLMRVLTICALQYVDSQLAKKGRSVAVLAGMLKYRMPPDVLSYINRLSVEL
ncbi:NIC-domain-containing protein [Schizophyllum commune Loenen D]|nr:NIC-domain-containing protein [Schizophyllum commune Loenen D]